MVDVADYDLQRTDGDPPPPARQRQPLLLLWVAGLALVIVVAWGAYYWTTRPAPGVAATEVAVTQRPAAADRPVEAAPPAIDVPPLDESDPLVRRLVGALSAHPRVVAWAATPDLIRNFTVVVENIAAGATPARHLRVLQPAGPFRVTGPEEALRIDPRSYARYDSVAAAVASVDAAGAANLYDTLKLRIQDAYRELGHEGPFDVAMERAIVLLLRTPIVEEDEPLAYRGALIGYADDGLEELAPAQKQLLRMGRRNMAIVQGKLREIALAIGIPARRLPAATAVTAAANR